MMEGRAWSLLPPFGMMTLQAVSKREVVLASVAWALVDFFRGLLASTGFVTRLDLLEEDTERGLIAGRVA